jgi:hypothetical protein
MTVENDSTNVSIASPIANSSGENATRTIANVPADILNPDFFSRDAFPAAPTLNKILSRLNSIEAIAAVLNRDVLAEERLEAHAPFSSRIAHGLLSAIEDLSMSAAEAGEALGMALQRKAAAEAK